MPPPLPALTDLDRTHDGSLDLRQHWFSGRFLSAKLEAAYTAYTLVVWRPRLRIFFVFEFCLESILMIRGYLCSCGLRFETYEGWARAYSFTFLMSSILILWGLLSPKLTHVTTRMMPWLIPAAVITDLIGYFVPLALYLENARDEVEPLPTDEAGMLSLVDQGAWFAISTVTFTMMTSLACVTFGVGAIAISLLMPVGIIFYNFFERKRFWHQFGIEPPLLLQSLIVYALCTILTFCHTGSTRQQFILRIYVQHERNTRVEQLEQEKERLEYERRFALRTAGLHSATNEPLTAEVAAAGATTLHNATNEPLTAEVAAVGAATLHNATNEPLTAEVAVDGTAALHNATNEPLTAEVAVAVAAPANAIPRSRSNFQTHALIAEAFTAHMDGAHSISPPSSNSSYPLHVFPGGMPGRLPTPARSQTSDMGRSEVGSGGGRSEAMSEASGTWA